MKNTAQRRISGDETPKKFQHEWWIGRTPKFMHPELDRVQTVADLDYQLSLEIDLAESGSLEKPWTAKQIYRAKMFTANVHMAALDFAREYPELVDDLNHSVYDDKSCPRCGQSANAVNPQTTETAQ